MPINFLKIMLRHNSRNISFKFLNKAIFLRIWTKKVKKHDFFCQKITFLAFFVTFW